MIEDTNQFSIILVTGHSRSGTTLMAEVLGTSETIKTLPEIHFFENLVDHRELEEGIDEIKKREIVQKLTRRSIFGFFESANSKKKYDPRLAAIESSIQKIAVGVTDPVILYKLGLQEIARHFDKRSVCDHTGKNIFFLRHILQLDCPVHVVHMVRNPHMVMRSQAGKWRVRTLGVPGIPRREAIRAFVNYNPLFEAITIRKIDAIVNETMSSGQNVLVLRYEDLTNATFRTLKRVGTFLGVDTFNHETIDVWGSSHPGQIARQSKGIMRSDTNVISANGLRERGGDYWCNVILKDYKSKYGYEGPKTSMMDVIAGLFWIVVTPAQFLLVVAFNLARSPNIIAALKRRLVR